ncbi:restriction endonuclease subunit S [Pedobacter sp. ISL-68]|uniref:methylation-associated defense system restriction endonuclease subunit S MAD5 n=1 Tax=unclassified Pedobacter TaxID=2628915 RepID=UPI001BEAB6AF|nr:MULTISPECIES: restriction endonuclease subunit S [unclassified Pedobacter]MBT2564699.1 restriction endonuclease subunit S [Pedobacter sp. ISL-64]MBT2592412.1 restriction endonuclease subunit S [Pedobacter sp. ISL-68]
MKIDKVRTLKISNNYIKRFDANFHLSEGQLAEKLISLSPYPLDNIRNWSEGIFYGGRSKRIYVNDSANGIPFGGITCMLQSGDLNTKYISRKHSENLDASFIRKGWILIARSGSGAIGTAQYVNKTLAKIAISEDVIRVVPKRNVLSGYMYAYLTSRIGYNIIRTGIFGSAIPHIEPHHIGDLPIPVIPEIKQQEIHDLIEEAYSLREEATQLIIDAKNQFNELNELDYPEEWLAVSENAIQLGYSVKMSGLFKTTIKARNHSLRAKKIIEYWNSAKGLTLNDYLDAPFKIGSRASFKRITSSNFKGHDLISQGDIHRQNPKVFKQVRAKRINPSDTAQRSSLIMPSAGTLGENEIFTRPLLVRSNFEGKLLSEVIGKFKCKTEMDAAYLFIALSSKAGFRILRAMVYGTNLLYPNWELIKEINIPVKSQQVKEIIGQKVIEAFDKRGLADKKENLAIELVENEIQSWQK